MKCIIIDDEPHARETLEDYLSKIEDVEVAGVFKDPVAAMEYVQHNTTDLIFTDITMPEMSGISFLRSLESPPLVVFITAHPDYAVEGFELDALDYIMKPYPFPRLLKAVNKAREVLDQQPARGSANQYMKIKDRNKTLLLKYSDIHYFEGMKDYVRIINNDKTIIAMYTMKELEKILPSSTFIRVQKSFIINIDMIKSVDKIKVFLKQDNREIPIGLQYKDAFFKRLEII